MKRSFLFALSLPLLLLNSCYYAEGPGYTSVGVGVGYYDTLPVGWNNPYYRYNNRYYYGGSWQTGRYYHNGTYYPGRYYHQGRYFYGGNYHPHAGSHGGYHGGPHGGYRGGYHGSPPRIRPGPF